MSERSSFCARALSGEFLDVDEAIDDAIEEWHDAATDLPVHAWLGMSALEYALFVERRELLPTILQAQRYGLALEDIIETTEKAEFALAARGLKDSEVGTLLSWLKRTGRI